MVKREKLIEFRGERSQQEMADKAGISQQAWDSWENGKTSPNLKNVKKIADNLGVEPEYFFSLFY